MKSSRVHMRISNHLTCSYDWLKTRECTLFYTSFPPVFAFRQEKSECRKCVVHVGVQPTDVGKCRDIQTRRFKLFMLNRRVVPPVDLYDEHTDPEFLSTFITLIHN